jgi:Sigma-70, region 4
MPGVPRKRTIAVGSKRLSRKRRLELFGDDDGDGLPRLPATRGDCVDGPRPCPYVSCRHHLYLEVKPTTGAVVFVRPDVDVDELERLPDTCSLDVADRGGVTLEELGRQLNVTRERARQLQSASLARAEADPRVAPLLRALAEGGFAQTSSPWEGQD